LKIYNIFIILITGKGHSYKKINSNRNLQPVQAVVTKLFERCDVIKR